MSEFNQVPDRTPYFSNSMEQTSSWEASSRSASQEITRLLLNPKDLYHVHKNPTLYPTLSQINPVHIPIPLFP